MLCSIVMRLRVAAFIPLLLLCSLPLRADSVSIAADRWATPRSGETVAGWSELRELMAAFDRRPDTRIVIHHAPGEMGSLWAEELRSWLVSLGVPSSQIMLKGNLQRHDIVRVETVP
ncbi:MAG: hypothetical protein R3268_09335 [Acidiferrobacterales bacterium]|nr:hypothetical protein [Acidiferrobacterales bacterium]